MQVGFHLRECDGLPQTRRSVASGAPKRKTPWAGDPPRLDGARQRLIDVTSECIAEEGVSRVGIAAVAERAGVSRPTVYRYFATRDELLDATLAAAGQEVAAGNDTLLGKFDDPRHMVVESALHVPELLRNHPVLSKIWMPAKDGQLDAAVLAFSTQGVPFENTLRNLRPLIDAAGWSEQEASEAVEVYVRFIVSLLLTPEPRRDKRELRAFLRRRLVPAMGL
jgi:AcrR family transcriptional regulator